MSTRAPADATAIGIRDALTEVGSEVSRQHQDVVENIAWVVGLASAMLAFIATKETWLANDRTLRSWLAVMLSVTVFLGVIQRAIHLRYTHLERMITVRVRFELLNLTADAAFVPEFADFWPREQVIANIRNHFDVDLSSPEFSHLTLANMREIYSQLREGWKEFSEERQTYLSNLLGATIEGHSERVLKEPDRPFAEVRESAIEMHKWERWSFVFYTATNGSFLISVALVLSAITGS